MELTINLHADEVESKDIAYIQKIIETENPQDVKYWSWGWILFGLSQTVEYEGEIAANITEIQDEIKKETPELLEDDIKDALSELESKGIVEKGDGFWKLVK